MSAPGFTAMLEAFEQARTVDFVRFVARYQREHPETNKASFAEGWNIVVGAYAKMATEAVPL